MNRFLIKIFIYYLKSKWKTHLFFWFYVYMNYLIFFWLFVLQAEFWICKSGISEFIGVLWRFKTTFGRLELLGTRNLPLSSVLKSRILPHSSSLLISASVPIPNLSFELCSRLNLSWLDRIRCMRNWFRIHVNWNWVAWNRNQN